MQWNFHERLEVLKRFPLVMMTEEVLELLVLCFVDFFWCNAEEILANYGERLRDPEFGHLL